MARTNTALRKSSRLANTDPHSAMSRRKQKKLERNKRIAGGCLRPAVYLQPKVKAKKAKPIKLTRKETITENKKRLFNMRRDAARYALLELEQKAEYSRIVLSTIDSDKKVKISFKTNNDVSCSCMDWRIRCKRMGISCKHILYVLDRIFRIDLESVVKNRNEKPEAISEALAKIIRARRGTTKFDVSNSKKMCEEDLCAICFCDFLYHTEEEFKDKSLCCPVCSNLVHADCMMCWLRNSTNHNCVYCRSGVWKDLVK